MKFNKEESKEIENVKMGLKRMRGLFRERVLLIEEYEDVPTPHSPSIEGNTGVGISQISRMNNYALKKELLLKKINMIDDMIHDFTIQTMALSPRQRQIVEVYMHSMSYKEMMNELNEVYYISTSTYKRELPHICLVLSEYIDVNDIPTIDEFHQLFVKMNLS